jgi:hypothetical protein
MRINQPTKAAAGAGLLAGLLTEPASRQQRQQLLAQFSLDLGIHLRMATAGTRAARPGEFALNPPPRRLSQRNDGWEQARKVSERDHHR